MEYIDESAFSGCDIEKVTVYSTSEALKASIENADGLKNADIVYIDLNAKDAAWLQEQIDNAPADTKTTVCISSSVTVEKTVNVPADKRITLIDDGSSHTLTSTAGEMFSVKGSLTIDATSEANALVFIGGTTTAASQGLIAGISDGGTLLFKQGIFRGGRIASNSSSAVYVDSGATFEMTGGVIEQIKGKNNLTLTAPVYVRGDGAFYMSGGCIQDNEITSPRSGGGVLLCGWNPGSPYAVMTMSGDAVIKENSAYMGGGMWFCPTGDATLAVTHGAAVYENTATGAGDDFVSLSGSTGIINLADRFLGGGAVEWYRDGGVKGSSGGLNTPPQNITGSVDESVPRFDPENPGSRLTQISGSVEIGTAAVGSSNTPESQKTEVTVYLKIGDHQLDSVILSPENNWTAAFTQLPDPDTLNEGLQYAVVGNPVPSDFEPQYQDAVIDGNKIYITIDNQYIEPPSGALTVSKAVTGNAGNTEAEFHFTVTLNDTSINGIYGDMTFKNGVPEFTLKHGESKTATGLPDGVQYTVTEDEANQNNYTTSSSGSSGTISAEETQTALFTNHRNIFIPPVPEKPTGDLMVSKIVSGENADTTKEFHFTVVLSDPSVSGVYGDMTFKNGVAEFTLKHGESKTAAGLPAGIHYTVTESCTGYQVTATGEQGTISENQSAAAVFNNVKETDTPPDTPDEPDVPGEPEDPDDPETPNPVEPEKPEKPDAPNQNVQDDVTPDSPKTGDTSALNFWLTLTAVTALALTAVVCAYQYPARKKHTHHRK